MRRGTLSASNIVDKIVVAAMSNAIVELPEHLSESALAYEYVAW